MRCYQRVVQVGYGKALADTLPEVELRYLDLFELRVELGRAEVWGVLSIRVLRQAGIRALRGKAQVGSMRGRQGKAGQQQERKQRRESGLLHGPWRGTLGAKIAERAN